MRTEQQLVRELRLQPGDRLVVPKSKFQIIQHFALYLGCDNRGQHYVSENMIGQGVVMTTAEAFFRRNPKVTRIERFKGMAIDRRAVVEKALSRLGQPYSLITNNCEHYGNDVSKDSSSSQQVKNAFGFFMLLLLGGIIVND